MKKLRYLLIIMLLLVTVGCFKTDKTYEYKAKNTDETIKVIVSDEYKLSEEEPIKVNELNERNRAITGSTSFVPSSMGLIIASEVIKDLIK